MLKEIQTAKLSEERKGGHSRGGPNGGKGSSLGHGGPNFMENCHVLYLNRMYK